MNNRRILVIDDDPDIRRTYKNILENAPDQLGIYTSRIDRLLSADKSHKNHEDVRFDLQFAAQGQEGFDLVKQALAKDKPFAVVFVDIRMPPGWDGIETGAYIRRIDPKVEIVMVTAYSDRTLDEIIQSVGAPDKLFLLRKPFDPEEITQLALSLTEKWNLVQQEEMHWKELETILMSTPAGIFTLDRNQNITSWNNAAERITGYSADEVVGKPCIYQRVAEDRKCQNCAIDYDNPTRKEVHEREITIKNKSGKRRIISKSINYITDTNGKVIQAVESFWDITDLKNAYEQLALEVKERERLANKNAVMVERGRMARELHDSVTQSLYSMSLFAETAKQIGISGKHDELDNCLDELINSSKAALKEMRLLVYDLRPSVLKKEGLAGAIQQRLDSVESRSGIKGNLFIEGQGELTELEEESIYRIAQETLNNALKHSAATNVNIRITFEDEGTKLEVEDNGIGFKLEGVSGKGGIGLKSIQERVEYLNGSLSLDSLGSGTTITVEIPRKKEQVKYVIE